MNKPTYIILGIFFLGMTIGNVKAGAIVERAVSADSAESSGGNGIMSYFISMFADLVGRVPYIGSALKSAVNIIGRIVETFEKITNNVLGRIVSAVVPCTISLSNVECSGVTSRGGWKNLIKGVIGTAPALLLPAPFGELTRIAINILLSGF